MIINSKNRKSENHKKGEGIGKAETKKKKKKKKKKKYINKSPWDNIEEVQTSTCIKSKGVHEYGIGEQKRRNENNK